jgi:hypothetical protein
MRISQATTCSALSLFASYIACRRGFDRVQKNTGRGFSRFVGCTKSRARVLATSALCGKRAISVLKEVKGSRPLAAWRPWTPVAKEAGLGWVEAETKDREALAQHLSYPLCIIFVFEGDREVIRIADQLGFAPQSWNDVVLEPKVEPTPVPLVDDKPRCCYIFLAESRL